jgi:predicted enzyme related to lactoylglutathione lyase
MSTIVHFEIPVDDLERAKNFYSKLFGWEMKDNSFPGMEYWGVMTSGEKPVHGGMRKREQPQDHIYNYIDVKSVVESSAKVEELGGKIIVSKMPVPGMGYFAVCMDTENNVFGVWENDENAK